MDRHSMDTHFQDHLTVVGYSSRIFRDNQLALDIDSEKHLYPIGSANLLVDRYDARNLLDDSEISQKKIYKRRKGNDSEFIHDDEDKEMHELLHYERYRDMVDEEAQSTTNDEKTNEENQVDVNETTNDVTPLFFRPKFYVPDHIQLPSSEMEHNIIAKTVIKVHKSRQLEVLLKLKLQGKSNFSFLEPGDPLHPYYNFLRQNERELSKQEEKKQTRMVAQSLLGDSYFEMDSENSDEEERHQDELLQVNKNNNVEDDHQHKNTVVLEDGVEKSNSVVTDEGTTLHDEKTVVVVVGNDSNPQNYEVGNLESQPTGDQKCIIDKVAELVGRNGKSLEDTVKEKEKDNSLFGFLEETSVYHNYYKRLRDQALLLYTTSIEDTPQDIKKKRLLKAKKLSSYFQDRTSIVENK